MKALFLFFTTGILVAAGVDAHGGLQVNVYVDAAPSKTLDSAGCSGWRNETKASAAAGTFMNMTHGSHPGRLACCPEDEAIDSPAAGWKRVTNCEIYNGGITATFGHAWLIGQGHSQSTPGALHALHQGLAAIPASQTLVRGLVRLADLEPRLQTIPLQVSDGRAPHVTCSPEPTSMGFLATALLGLLGYRLRRSRR